LAKPASLGNLGNPGRLGAQAQPSLLGKIGNMVKPASLGRLGALLKLNRLLLRLNLIINKEYFIFIFALNAMLQLYYSGAIFHFSTNAKETLHFSILKIYTSIEIESQYQ
tara:strand:- start:308 stop:637 length:330 start_codon:yes stop_codon:yes gene_type:complete